MKITSLVIGLLALIAIVAVMWGVSMTGNVTYLSQSQGTNYCSDSNGDGEVDVVDLLTLVDQFGGSCNNTECSSDAECPTITENFCDGALYAESKVVAYSCVNNRCIMSSNSTQRNSVECHDGACSRGFCTPPTSGQVAYLSSNGNSSVYINGSVVELVSAAISSATFKVANTKEIAEGTSKEIGGLNFYLISADSNNSAYSARALINNGSVLSFSSDANSTQYLGTSVIELISASTTSATFKVANTKEIAEGTSKNVGGLNIYLISADSSNLAYSATIRVF